MCKYLLDLIGLTLRRHLQLEDYYDSNYNNETKLSIILFKFTLHLSVILFTGGGGLPDRDPPGQRPPRQRPPGQRPLPWTETPPWTEIPLDGDPPGQRPPVW